MKIMIKKFFGYHDALKIYGAPITAVKLPVFRLQRGSAKSPLAPSVLDLYGYPKGSLDRNKQSYIPIPFGLSMLIPNITTSFLELQIN